MAILNPSLDKILSLKVKPEEGELHLIKFLINNLDNSYEIFFNPYMNGDRPDIVIIKKNYGVLIIEVKDYDLNKYFLDERKNLVVKSTKANTYKSPISQVLKYKENLFELHIENLFEKKIKNIKYFNIVKCCVYFHNATNDEIKNMFINPFIEDKNYSKFLKYNFNFIGKDNLNKGDFNELLKKTNLISEKSSFLFTNEIYESIKRFIQPNTHLKEDGVEIRYSQKQLEIIYEKNKKQQRVKGVVGSGKTTVLAARAVQAHKRTKSKVLILTYNITLKNYIKDKISKVKEDFEWGNFIILNYHLFINTVLNNLDVDFEIPYNFDLYSKIEKENYFEKKYYSNKKLFFIHKDKLQKYDAIFIDEIQDYKRAWMEIIKEYFLNEGGEYVLFGDVKQNIYTNNKITDKDVSTNVVGVTQLKSCFRSDFKIKDLAILYQKEVFRDKYEIDNFNEKTNELPFEFNKQGALNYIYLPEANNIVSLFTIIHQNTINKNIHPNDITVLGTSISILKKFDAYYRNKTNERTNTMFESIEIMYKMRLGHPGNEFNWINDGVKLMKREKDKNKDRAYNQLSKLLTLYDLNQEYVNQFNLTIQYYCQKFKVDYDDFLVFVKKYENQIVKFKQGFNDKSFINFLNKIRTNKKVNFYMNSGTIKISTIKSFKGWESDTVFLIIEKNDNDLTFDEILYTGLTRTKSNLVLINYGNEKYNSILKNLINEIK